ncbi:MAG: DNA polymerase I, partial [Caldilineaceae bacterium]|nr:DNA polymerase I [Caldilineaceae bacterium]
REYKPDHVAVAFDLGDTWRHSTFPEYKATRERMPDDMRTQLDRIQELVTAFNIPIVTYPDYEADDVLGTLARQAAAEGSDVLILTGDRDMFQLVDDRVKILYTSGGPNPKTSVYGPEEVAERYGLTPTQFIDLKALTGDTSDNIPGVPGVGDKTAAKFLTEYGTLENLYAHIDEVSGPKTRQNLIDAKEQVELNKQLVTIVTDLDMTYDADACKLRDYDRQKVVDLFNALEFRSLLKELPQSEHDTDTAADEVPRDEASGQMALFGDDAAADAPAVPMPAGPPTDDYRLIQDDAALAALAETLAQAKRISFDVETDSTDAMVATLVGLGVAWDTGDAAYIPVGHSEGAQVPWDAVRAALQPAFADATIPKLAHNAKYDFTVCRRHGLDVAGPIHDTMVMAWLLDPASRSLGLKAQADAELGWTMTELTDLIGSGRKQITMDAVAIAPAGMYCCADVDATIRLYDTLAPRLREAGLWSVYAEIELPLIPVLTDMEMTGISLDTEFLAEMSDTLGTRLAALEEELMALVGHEFNLRSTQQLSDVLFNELGFPTKGLKKTSSGHYSTAVATLDALAANAGDLTPDQKRVLDIIFEQRQLEKLRGTYVDALPALVNPATGRVHTNFNQTGAVTGRMSSSNPNLQNIPIRTELGREIRRAFLPADGWVLLSADYSQVELRVLAHVAQEHGLIDAFRADQDIHAATAARL